MGFKSRLTSTDLFHIVAELRDRILGSYTTNIYDLDSRIFLFKFHRPGHNETVLFESGVRFHSTTFTRDTGVPSGFTLKLRKHLRGRRLTNIECVGCDRKVKLTFGQGDSLCYLVLEVFTPGNVILLDPSCTILSCLRRSVPGTSPEIHVGSTYVPEEHARSFQPVTLESLSVPLEKATRSAQNPSRKKKRKGLMSFPENTVGFALSTFFSLGPQYAEFVLAKVGIDPATLASELLANTPDMTALCAEFQELEKKLLAIDSFNGFIVFNQEAPSIDYNEAVETGVSINELISRKVRALDPKSIISFVPAIIDENAQNSLRVPSFNFAVDLCFSRLEEMAAQSEVLQRQQAVDQKLTKIEDFHASQVKSLENTEMNQILKARVVEENVQLVESIVETIKTCVDSGLSWTDIENLIEEGGEDGLGQFISSTNFAKRLITIQLPLFNEETKSEDRITVELSIDESPMSNLRSIYEKAKKARSKKGKALDAHSSVVKRAEKKAKSAIDHMSLRASVVHARTSYWFEKFNWFISSENFIVVGGRDLQQNEILVKRYLEDGDIYVHSAIHGASSVIVKVKDQLPTSVTLNEAGAFAVNYSRSFDSKVACAAYWVFGSQVGTAAPTGQHMPSGSFLITGRRNYLETSPLVLGVGILFKLGDTESILRHKNDRKIRDSEEDLAVLKPEAEARTLESVQRKEKTEALAKIEHDGEEVKASDEGNIWEEALNRDQEDKVDNIEPRSLTQSKESFKSTKKKISARDRKLMKKAQSLGISFDELLAQKEAEKAEEQQRLLEKQEKERRELEERQLLESLKVPSPRDIDEEQPTQQEEPEPKPTAPLRCFNCGGPHKRQDCPHEKLKAHEKRKRIKQDEEVEEVLLQQEREAAQADLSSLCHAPLPEDLDSLLYAIPVVAPWTTVQHYTHRVKVTPGSTKKGKASQCIIEHLAKSCRVQRERDLIKCLNNIEIASRLPGKVSVNIRKK
ncbi:hypothetical protein P9112_004704 [Eukaryota sp. TZLM1-RC]